MLEVHFPTGEAFTAGSAIVGRLPGIVVDEEASLIQIPVGDGATSSLQILRSLDDGGVDLLDFQLRRPTLDDVFLTKTKDLSPTRPEGAKP